ncbi:hypothetical protein CRENBAI_012119 [Crenichthys baileyi]|uniref:Uncharacterized protein n=1 Tax=Crenichthys baileyi TaxID=28760 RepID=A0AAV9SIP2_9TELE
MQSQAGAFPRSASLTGSASWRRNMRMIQRDRARFGFHGALRDHNEMPGEKRRRPVAQDDM